MEVESSALDAALGREEGEHKFNLLVKYIVRPSIAKEFIGEFLKVRRRSDLPSASSAKTPNPTTLQHTLFVTRQHHLAVGASGHTLLVRRHVPQV